jgi:hypothetical protein
MGNTVEEGNWAEFFSGRRRSVELHLIIQVAKAHRILGANGLRIVNQGLWCCVRGNVLLSNFKG